MAFGIHVVDHYSRNYLTPSERDRLVDKLVVQVWSDIDRGLLSWGLSDPPKQKVTAKDVGNTRARPQQTLKGLLAKLEQCRVMHLDAPGSRDEFHWQSSLWVTANFLTCAFIQNSDVPLESLSDWSELDPKILKLNDSAQDIAWDFHGKVKSELDRRMVAAGFEKVRDLGPHFVQPRPTC